jgi:hypothetical protein
MQKWSFTFDGIKGVAETYCYNDGKEGIFVFWGGMGFHCDNARKPLLAAILAARP